MARSDGADTAHTIGIPATAAFWTISKLTRPETMSRNPLQPPRADQDLRADELVERVVAADVLADGDELARGREQAGRVEAAGLVEGALGGAKQVRAARG